MDPNEKQWSPEYDALIAAPGHHRLLFENDAVRVLDTNIPPGEMTNLHTHQYPASLYFISFSDFTRYDEGGNIIVDSRDLNSKPAASSAIWTGPLPLHALKNVGENNLHVISVELKNLT